MVNCTENHRRNLMSILILMVNVTENQGKNLMRILTGNIIAQIIMTLASINIKLNVEHH